MGTKLSQLPTAGALTDVDLVYVVQGGASARAPLGDVRGLPDAASAGAGSILVSDGTTWLPLDPPPTTGLVLSSAATPTGLAWATTDATLDPILSYMDEVLSDTPSGFWLLNGSLADRTGNGHTMTLQAGVTTWTADGTIGDDALDASAGFWSHDVAVGQSAYTLEAVARRVGANGTDGTLISDWGGAGAAGAMLINVSGTMTAYHGGDSLAIGTVDTSWHSWAVTWDGTTQRVYVDGVLIDTRADGDAPGHANGATASPGLSHYGYVADDGRRFPGLCYAAAVYPTALTATRLLAHHQALGL